MSLYTGRVHSVQSLGAVDGPGLRYVVFLQGCPLRCVYCHNPDTWDFFGGNEWQADDLATEILKYRPYFGTKGGVTVSGGEPLAQPEFVRTLFSLLRKQGVHTALDTSGACDLTKARQVLEVTDLVLCDLKFLTEEDYREKAGISLAAVQSFLRLTEERDIPLWIRHVVVPGLTDSAEQLRRVQALARQYRNLQKIEWLPFHKLCMEKYDSMVLPFPLRDTPAMDSAALQGLIAQLI